MTLRDILRSSKRKFWAVFLFATVTHERIQPTRVLEHIQLLHTLFQSCNVPSEVHRHDVVPTRLNHIKPTFQILLPPGPAVKAAFQAHETVRTAQVHLRHRMAAVGNRFSFVFYSSKYIKRQNMFLWCLSRIHKLVLWALKMEKTYRSCDLRITSRTHNIYCCNARSKMEN